MSRGSVCLLGLLLLLLFSANNTYAWQQTEDYYDWLEKDPITNWNKAGENIPKAPKTDGLLPTSKSCRSLVRAANIDLDQRITSANWALFGSLQVFGKTTIIAGLAGFDSMCRPLGYQAFVFVNGRFAGTVSPIAMNARTDGSFKHIYLMQEDKILVEFDRYGLEDLPGTPSHTSYVTFLIKKTKKGPIIVPDNIVTKKNVDLNKN